MRESTVLWVHNRLEKVLLGLFDGCIMVNLHSIGRSYRAYPLRIRKEDLWILVDRENTDVTMSLRFTDHAVTRRLRGHDGSAIDMSARMARALYNTACCHRRRAVNNNKRLQECHTCRGLTCGRSCEHVGVRLYGTRAQDVGLG